MEGSQPAAKRLKHVYTYIDDEEEGEEEEANAGGLRRLDSRFVRSEQLPAVRAPDWQRAWVNFLQGTAAEVSFHYNPRLRGLWTGLMFFLAEFEATVQQVARTLVEERLLPDEQRSIRTIQAGGLAGG